MAVSVTLRTSTDAGNLATFGTDGGLLVSSPPPPRSGQHGVTIDNSFSAAAATDYWYTLPTISTISATMTSNVAFIFPIMFSRNCQISGGRLNVGTAGAGSNFYATSYAADTSTGLPSTKLTDLFTCSTATVAVATLSLLDTSATYGRTYTAQTLYWIACWAQTTSAFPITTMRQGSQYSPYSLRLPSSVTPTASTLYTGLCQLAYCDSSQSWSQVTSGPSALTLTQPTAAPTSITGLYAPQIWFSLRNV